MLYSPPCRVVDPRCIGAFGGSIWLSNFHAKRRSRGRMSSRIPDLTRQDQRGFQTCWKIKWPVSFAVVLYLMHKKIVTTPSLPVFCRRYILTGLTSLSVLLSTKNKSAVWGLPRGQPTSDGE